MFAPNLILLLVVRYSFSVTVALVGDLNATGVDIPPQMRGSPPESAAVSISRNQARPSSVAPPFGVAAMATTRRGRRKRVVIYTRYSTNEQNDQSLSDQEAVCRGAVDRCGIADADIEVLADAAVSGEMANRRGMDRLWELIETQACDIIVAEEVSRFYRHTTRAMQFIESAVDADIRVITLNDPIDTLNDEWRLHGHFASLKAELDNRQTRQRIQRSMVSRWEKGYTVHHTLLPGYLRVPVAEPNNPPKVRRPDYTRQPPRSRDAGTAPGVLGM